MSADPRELLRRLLGPLDGARIAGGCDFCDAYQVATPLWDGAWTIAVHHDDWCPWLARRERGRD